MLADLAAIILPVAVCIAIGVVLGRRTPDYPSGLVGTIVADIGAPCLVFHSLAAAKIEVHVLGQMALGTSAALAVFAVLGYGIAKLARWEASTFVPPVVFSNCGNMGLPLSLFAFGEQGLGLAVASFATFAFWQFSFGIWLWSGSISPGVLARSPLSWSAALGFAVHIFGWQVPVVVHNTTELIGGLAIPLMLITLGVSLGAMRARSLPRTLTVSALRLCVGPAVGWLIADALALEGAVRGVLVLQCAMPVAVFNYLLALRYDRSPEDVASLVVVSTALSLLTLPPLLWFLLAAL